MMEHLVGREEEGRILQDCLESTRSEFVALYGRRRVGKTFLIKTLFEKQFTFYATGVLNGTREDQLVNFGAELTNYGGDIMPPVTSWRDAFDRLRQLIDAAPAKEKKIVFLDEVPWMATAKSGFLSALDYFWNRWVSSRGDVLLIVCGSATSWIIKNIVDNTGGLHNRLTRQILLPPFSLKECESLLKQNGIPLTRYQIAEAYMIFGGIPYYLSLMRPDLSLYQNVDALYFKESALLANEYRNLFQSLFKNAKGHIKVVEALAQKGKGLTREEIINATKIAEGGGFTNILEELMYCGFVRRYLAFGKKERDRLYQLIDPFTFFHLRFYGKREAYSENFWLQFSVTPAYAAWIGYAFEQVCFLHVPQIKQRLGISGVLTEVFSWRSSATKPGAQIDLILDRSDKVINLCEIKFVSGQFEIDKDYSENLRHKRSAFASETRTRKAAHTTMITTYGLRRNAYAAEIPFEVMLDDLFA
jgi:predicted AAA+ superfamily ATPase